MKIDLIVRLEPENEKEAIEYKQMYDTIRVNFGALQLAWNIDSIKYLLITKRFGQ